MNSLKCLIILDIMDKRKSETWNNFTLMNDEKAKCNFCSNSFSFKGGSTANLTRHLKRKHPVQFESRKKNPRIETNDESPDDPNEIETISESSQTNSSVQPHMIVQNTPKVIQRQAPIDAYVSRPISITKSKKIDEQLGIMIAKEYQPFSLVENKEFIKFVSLLNQSYCLPSRKTLSNNIIPQILESTKEKVKNSLKNALFIAMSTDGWTSINNESYVAITVHFIDKELCILKSHLLGCYYFEKSHTAENLSSFLNQCFEEWSISNKVKVAISDNAANITAAIGLNSNWRHIPCLAHSINLIAQSGLQEIQEVHIKVKKIVERFKRSSQAAAKLKNTQIQMGYSILKLKQDVITRWNSTYDMFSRCLETKDPLLSTLAMIGNVEMLTSSDFIIMEHYCKLFKPFKEVTVELSAEKGVSISKVIVLTNALLTHIKKIKHEVDLPKSIETMIFKMEQNAEKRFSGVEDNPIFAEATLLDPRFKKKGFSNDAYYRRTYQNVVKRISNSIKNKQNIISEENIVRERVNEKKEKETYVIWQEFDSQV